MAVNKTSLSAGEIIRALLINDKEVTKRVTKVFPVVIESEARLPYIVYRRTQLMQNPTKAGGADTVGVEVLCYTKSYTEGIELAEAVRKVLDHSTATTDEGLTMRSCYLVDSEEAWQDDAYLQQLVFNVKI